MASEAVLSTLRRGWLALEPLHLPMAVVGGLALAAWKHARFTRDADLLIAADESALGAIQNALEAAGFYARHSPLVSQIDQQKIVQFRFLPPDGKFPIPTQSFAGERRPATSCLGEGRRPANSRARPPGSRASTGRPDSSQAHGRPNHRPSGCGDAAARESRRDRPGILGGLGRPLGSPCRL